MFMGLPIYQLTCTHFRNIPHIVKELLEIGKKIHVYYYVTNIRRQRNTKITRAFRLEIVQDLQSIVILDHF
jgi:hypothetical protein